jgi:hypothetical protein
MADLLYDSLPRGVQRWVVPPPRQSETVARTGRSSARRNPGDLLLHSTTLVTIQYVLNIGFKRC